MIQRISGCLRGMIALGPLPLRTILGIILSSVVADAGMENCRFALHYKPKYVYSKAMPSLCDNPATVTEEPNYSPNYTNTPCTNYSTWCEPMGAGQVYLVIGRAGSEGVAAASFGITYGGSSHTGIDPAWVTWTPCADGLSFPNGGVNGEFPQPGGGLRITWNNATSCQTEIIGSAGVHAVVGVFYVYAYSHDSFQVTTNNNLSSGVPELAVANCAGVLTDLYQVWGPAIVSQMCGRVGFNESGYNPCALYGPEISTVVTAPCTTPVRHTTWGRMKSTFREVDDH